MDNGDKAFVQVQGSTVTSKEGRPESGEGTWWYTGGAGKLKGIAGKGSYKSTMGADGQQTMIEGAYTIAAPAPAKK